MGKIADKMGVFRRHGPVIVSYENAHQAVKKTVAFRFDDAMCDLTALSTMLLAAEEMLNSGQWT